MAIALMVCITFKLKLVGRLGSFFLKKYMHKINKKKKAPGYPELSLNNIMLKEYYFLMKDTRRFCTRPSSVLLSAIGLVSP